MSKKLYDNALKKALLMRISEFEYKSALPKKRSPGGVGSEKP